MSTPAQPDMILVDSHTAEVRRLRDGESSSATEPATPSQRDMSPTTAINSPHRDTPQHGVSTPAPRCERMAVPWLSSRPVHLGGIVPLQR
ncbi:hypothetical protein PCANC_25303 [Puccinia coronata f. sp. avenae]|uniref:Uncharacterized protein n=1 Tax=Puccinia coronata f. sp. avenae TaxID=200324 RepID=A0A2N5THV9_9BASI|nr:hypothetical protein PCANC_25303 [Puccinia coronata f. sp. avenae]